MKDMVLYAAFAYAVNRENGLDEEMAKGDAIFLANVIDSRAQKGWSGKSNRGGSQVIPSKVVVKDGVMRDYKMFGGKVMNGKAFDKIVVEGLGSVRWQRLLSVTRQEIKKGKDLSKTMKTLRGLL